LDKNTTSSVKASDYESLSFEQGANSESMIDQIFAVNNCTSGVFALNDTMDYFIFSDFGDRVVEVANNGHKFVIWGIQEECYGRPLDWPELY